MFEIVLVAAGLILACTAIFWMFDRGWLGGVAFVLAAIAFGGMCVYDTLSRGDRDRR